MFPAAVSSARQSFSRGSARAHLFPSMDCGADDSDGKRENGANGKDGGGDVRPQKSVAG
jgi:hypothetical protein